MDTHHMNTHHFMAIRSWEPATVARIEFDSEKEREEAFRALTSGVGDWLGKTANGQDAWAGSSENFNWGDLSMHLKYASLIEMLEKHGVYNLKINTTVNGLSAVLEFDEIFRPNRGNKDASD